MNPFPDFIIRPSTAHRIPRTPDAEKLINKLLTHEVNAYAFLMDVDLLAGAEAKGFHNNSERALGDLTEQLPSNIREAVFPPPPQDPDEDESDEGKDSAPLKGMELKISTNDLLIEAPKTPSKVVPEKKLGSFLHTFSPHFPDCQQGSKKKRSGTGLRM